MQNFITALAILFFTAFFMAACSKPVEVDPQIEILEKRIQKLGTQLQKLETEVQNAESDPALKAKLQEDQKLTESRKARLAHDLKKRKPEPDPAAGGHGGGHGEAPPAHH